MKPSLAVRSLLLLGISVLFLTILTVASSKLSGVSSAFERLLTALLLIVPTGLGAILAATSLFRKEGRKWLATISLILNGLFSLFFILLVLFAG